ncbi:MAG: fused response regulator/phosphatase [Gammaproteobacteria bacterium]|nr:fused response regulator/phosphatase [Gammaproteobacteria bacterium]
MNSAIIKESDAEGYQSTILVIDDDMVSIDIISAILKSERSYRIIFANDGVQGLNLHKKFKPDLIIMDILMEGVDGYQTTINIMKHSPGEFVPVIFVTAIRDPIALSHCFDVGGIDYIEKPYNPTVLRSKIKTFLELKKLYKETQAQHYQLQEHNRALVGNYRIAEELFKKVMYTEVLDAPGFSYSLSPIAIFNGDILMAAYQPSGELNVILGDFTGHGISAAIGAIPVADIFYSMTSKGFGIADIAREINTKLCRIMPRGLFLAACILSYSHSNKTFSICNAGIPVAMFYSKERKKISRQFISKNLPLGIHADTDYSGSIDNRQIKEHESIMLCTDGVVESTNSNKEMYGVQRIIDCLEKNAPNEALPAIQKDLDMFISEETQKDDLTIVEIDFETLSNYFPDRRIIVCPNPIKGSTWEMHFVFDAVILKSIDPLPTIVETLMQYQKFQLFKQDLFIIIKELFTNSLEHGALQLNSELKQQPDGFSQYYLQRQQRLADLVDSEISIHIAHTPTEQGGVITITVRDNGSGFDFDKFQTRIDDAGSYHGRGILLVNSLCRSLKYSNHGRQAQAVYEWSVH